MAPVTSLAGATEQALATALGYGIGVGLAAALTPEVVLAAQARWASDPTKVVEVGTAAAIVAESVEAMEWGKDEAAHSGIDGDRFEAIVGEVLTAPGMSELLTLLRRKLIGVGDVTHGLQKAKLEERWFDALTALKDERLEPAVIATAIQRGIMGAPFPLPYSVNVPEGNVTPFAVSPLDAQAEAEAHGIDVERLRIETALVGLPMALDRAAQAHFRGILTDGDYLRAVLEGNARGEWAEAELAVARQILTAHDYAELQLRGFYDRERRLANTGKHGMSVEDSDWLYDVLGRSIAVHAVTTGLARGGKLGGGYADVPEPYRSALQRSNLREEWAGLAYANRYSYSVPLWWRALLTAGALDPEEAHQVLLNIGNPPDLARKITDHYAGGGGATADKHVQKAETQLWTALHKSYVDDATDDAQAEADLGALGLADATITQVLRFWQLERKVVRRSLTPVEIRKAIGQPGRDAAWAAEALLDLGFSPDDAAAFLAE